MQKNDLSRPNLTRKENVISFPEPRKSPPKETVGGHSDSDSSSVSSGKIPATIVVVESPKSKEKWVVVWLPWTKDVTIINNLFKELTQCSTRGNTCLFKCGDENRLSALIVLPSCPQQEVHLLTNKCRDVLKRRSEISAFDIQHMRRNIFRMKFPNVRPTSLS